jgi:hypothetical protein
VALTDIRVDKDFIGKWTALSTDAKPTLSAVDGRVGSEVWEIDTGNRYTWDGANWNLYSIGAAPLSILADPSDASRQQEFDPLFKAPLWIDIGHHEIHEGDAFLCSYADISMANTDTFVVAFKTIAGTKRMHLLYSFNTLAGGHLDIYKDSTWDAETGSLLPIYNHLQLDTSASSTMLENQSTAGFTATDNLILDPTNLSHGTKVIPSDYVFGNNQKSGETRSTAEIILEPDTLHTILFTADGGSNAGQVKLNWYEHTDG